MIKKNNHSLTTRLVPKISVLLWNYSEETAGTKARKLNTLIIG